MATRTILLAAISAFLFIGIVRADGTANLTGHTIKTKEAVRKAEAIFVGKITELGSETTLDTTIRYVGTAYKGFKVKVLQVVLGSVGSQASVTLIVDFKGHEVMPKVGTSYIFFATYNTYDLTSVRLTDS